MKKSSADGKVILKYFEGTWDISRNMSNFHSPKYNGTAEGEVKITPDPKVGLSYSEKVKVKFANGVEASGTQNYVFQLDKGVVSQYRSKFAGSKELEKMYSLEFFSNKDRLLAKHEYTCGKDLYRVEYSIYDYNNFVIQYMVTGPEKNYITQTSFIRE